MNLSRQSRIAIICNLVFVLLAALVATVEAPEIPDEWRRFYLCGKLGFPVLALFLIPSLARNPYGLVGNIGTAIMMIGYSVLGGVFRPLYSLSFVQAALALAFLYAIPRNIYGSMLVIWAGLLIAAESYGLKRGFWTYASGTQGDEVTIVISFAVVAFIVHRFFLAERIFREQSLRRFSVIGKQSALILHDIKSLMTAPRIHLQTLEQSLQAPADRELLKIVRNLDDDLTRVRDLTVELNRLSSHRLSPDDTASVLECAERGRTLLGARSRSIAWAFPSAEEDRKVRLSDPRLTAVFLHLFTNAWEAFERRGIPEEKRQIFLVWQSETLVVQDTAGGIPDGILRLLQRKQFSTSRPEGSGLGTFLIDDTLHEIGGRASFENSAGGARIQLRFPRRSFC